ncbi:MAG TPA: putative colanic acid biosynthesis acetyltransferase [Acidobacteriaceae bacterium]|jgi:putative colanic acid biosynthesis acetyltransferase WcaF|nr:putative colanic acid biosynthesis acetyltransferase [Acidobacteriaceae bacterium]
MPRPPDYRASDHIGAEYGADLYTRPAFSRRNRAARLLWNLCWLLLYRPSPRPFHAWRAALLRLFGAQLGPDCHFYPRSRVWAPWNLHCADHVAAGNGVEIYNPSPIQLGSHVILSQDSYLCGATHDYNDPAFPLIAFRMRIDPYAWICARASVAPGVHIGEGAVLGLGSVATRDLEPWTVFSGNPAQPIRQRQQHPSTVSPSAETAAP